MQTCPWRCGRHSVRVIRTAAHGGELSANVKIIVAGRLACALNIVHAFPYENLAIRKAYQVMQKSLNPMDPETVFPPDEAPTWELLKLQSRTYFELEQIIDAIKALATWREAEADYIDKHPKLSGASPTLKSAKEAVDEAMHSVLHNHILLHPLDADEEADLTLIRKHYLPELILAYNAVLHSAGYLISRENLVESMELSVCVADDELHLAECFVDSGRMRELVTSFSQTSKSMLVLKASGKKWTSRKDRRGKDLGIWEMGAQGGGGGPDDGTLALSRQISLS